MTSILTNVAAMNAVSALTATQRSLAQTQRQVSTGLRVASAQDNAAYWSIATAMRSRIGTLQAVNEGLSFTASIIGVTTAALDTVRADVEDIKDLILTAQTAGVDKVALQSKIALDQKNIVSAAEAASFNGVNWLVTRMTGTDVTREDATEGGPQAAYNTTQVPPWLYASTVKIVETQTTTQTLGSTSSGVTQKTGVSTDVPDPMSHQVIASDSDTTTTSGDPLGYRNVDILFSSGDATAVDLHPIELFKNFVGTEQSTAYVSYSDTPSFEYGADPDPVTSTFNPYLTLTSDDALDALISTPDQEYVLTTVLNLDVTQTVPQDLLYLASGLESALNSVISGQSFLGSLANRVSGQQTYNAALIDALASGVGSLVDADMNETSTRLTALQTQQQLGLQSLSIANDNMTLLLRLFGVA